MTGEESSAGVLSAALAAAGPGIAVDPLPPAAIRVGGIGHRVIPEHSHARIRATLERALGDIAAATRSALRMPSVDAYYSGAPVFALVTPLAEGADRLIAQSSEGCDSPWRLGTILPFTQSAYEDTFNLDVDRAGSVAEFRRLLMSAMLPRGYGTFILDTNSSTEDERMSGYRAAASTIIRWCDILVSVVEHKRLESETGYGLREAIAWNVPVIIVDPTEPDSYRLVLDGVELPATSDVNAALSAAVEVLLGATPLPGSQKEIESLRDYIRESVDYDTEAPVDFEYQGPYSAHTVAAGWIAWGARVNRSLRVAFKGLLLRKAGNRIEPSSARDLPFDDATSPWFVSNFLRYSRADSLARLYGDLHRGVQIVAVVVGILAALAALIHALVEGLPSAAFTLFEFLCLVFMYAAVKTSHRQRWLQRWIDYRLLAEIMRHAKFLAVAGRSTPFADLRSPVARAEMPARHWVENHVRAVLRAQAIAVPGRTAKTDPNSPSKIKTYVADRLALDQLIYHAQTASYQRSLDTMLRRILDILTPVTITLIGMKFVAEWWAVTPWFHEGFEVPLILLPAITSGIIATRAANQYAVTARRSDGMVTAMRFHRDAVLATTNFSELGERSAAVSRALLGEVEGWTDVFSDRHIEIEV